MPEYILIDNFFNDVNSIRNYALSLSYENSSKITGWKGDRTSVTNTSILEYIKSKLVDIDAALSNLELEVYFYYSIDETKNEIKDFSKNRLHKDVTEWAGVIYLTPNPPLNSGTTLHRDNGELICNIENIYNRFIFYKGNTLHGVLNTFGNTIEDSRITITIFGNNTKKVKTLL